MPAYLVWISVRLCGYLRWIPHEHPVDPAAVTHAQAMAMVAPEAELVVARLGLLCEPTRLRALQALSGVSELCVGDVALALGVSEDAAGYALRQLRRAGFVAARREGRVVFYGLAGRFPRTLLTDCVVQLSTLEAGGEELP